MYSCLAFLLGFLNPKSTVSSIMKMHQLAFDFIISSKAFWANLETILLLLSNNLKMILSIDMHWYLNMSGDNLRIKFSNSSIEFITSLVLSLKDYKKLKLVKHIELIITVFSSTDIICPKWRSISNSVIVSFEDSVLEICLIIIEDLFQLFSVSRDLKVSIKLKVNFEISSKAMLWAQFHKLGHRTMSRRSASHAGQWYYSDSK